MRFKTLIFLVILLFLENLVKGGWVDFKNRVYCTVTFGRHYCDEDKKTPPVKSEAEIKTHNLIINGIHDEVLLQVKSLPSLNKDVEFKAPYLIKRNYSHKELVNYSQKWNWNDDYNKIIKIEEKTNNNFVNQLNIAKENSVELEIQKKLTPEILKEKTKFIASIVTSNVPKRCSVVENLNKVETIFLNLCKHNEKFDTDQFRIEVKFAVDNLATSNTTLEESEIDELSVLVLSTNNELDKIFNRIENEVREKLISSMKKIVVSNIKAKHSYYDIMEQIGDSIQKIYSLQSNQSDLSLNNEGSINTNFIINKNPKEKFTIPIEDIIGKLREDSDFFEFIPMNKIKPNNSSISMNEGFINVPTLLVSGVAPSKSGKYEYTLDLRYTYIKDGGISNTPITITLIVCGQQYKCEEQKESQEETPREPTNGNGTSTSEEMLGTFEIFILVSVISGVAIYITKIMRDSKLKPQNIQTENDFGMERIDQEPHQSNDIEEAKQNELNGD